MAVSKKKVLRILAISAISLIAIVIIALVVISINLDTIARKGIVSAMSYILQVDVKLEKVDLKPLSGKCRLEKLVIGNTADYKTPECFSADVIDVSLDIKSFRTDEPIINKIYIKDPRITLEQGLTGSNITAIIDNADRFSGDKKTEEPEEKKDDAAQKYVRIDEIVVEGAKVSLSAPLLQGNALTIPLPTITMNDIGGKKEKVTIAQSIKIFFTEIIKSVASVGDGLIPDELGKQIKGSLGKVMNTVTDTVGDATKGVSEGIKKLF